MFYFIVYIHNLSPLKLEKKNITRIEVTLNKDHEGISNVIRETFVMAW